MAGTDAGAVTAWQVLTHTTGLPDMAIESLRRERPTYERSVRWLREARALTEPGSAYAYNSVAFTLLAEVMRALGGVPFDEALAERLTGPLGMADTTFDARPLRERVLPVHGVGADNRLVQEVLLRFLAASRMPGGGMFGTLRDLLRLGRALLPPDPDEPGPRVLSQSAIDEMSRNHTEGWTHVSEDGVEREVRQGLGWRVPQRHWPGSSRAFTHGGITGGRLWIEPEHGFSVAFLTNYWQGAHRGIAERHRRGLRGTGLSQAAPPSSIANRASCSPQIPASRSAWRTIQGSTRLLSSMVSSGPTAPSMSMMPLLLR